MEVDSAEKEENAAYKEFFPVLFLNFTKRQIFRLVEIESTCI